MLSTHYTIVLANTAVLADRFTKMCNVFLCLKNKKNNKKKTEKRCAFKMIKNEAT